MDRGYVDLVHFQDLSERGVIWVTRMKATMKYDVWKDYDVAEGGPIISDQWVCLTNGLPARVIVARVMVDGKEREMTFVTNQMEWAASTIVELYRCRWEIEVFFKQMKQTLKLCDLMSYSANGIRWQIWIAMLVQMLMRYLAWESNWSHSFVRLYGIVRSVIWKKASIRLLLEGYGTAGGLKRWLAEPQEAYLPGFG
jgi:IS4 transposase